MTTQPTAAFKAGRFTVLHPEYFLTSYTTWNGARIAGTKVEPLGLALRALDDNDRRTGCSPLAPYFDALAKLGDGEQLTAHNPNGYVHHFVCTKQRP